MASASSFKLIVLIAAAATCFCLLSTVSYAARHDAVSFNTTLAQCKPSGTLHGPPGSHSCDECCKSGKAYPQYTCSPPVTSSTKATLTVNDFDVGGDGGAPSECDNSYHRNSEHVVALSTRWYAGGSRCGQTITIHGNGRSVTAKVVDECDSVNGCDKDHAYEPPCANNIVDASSSVWQALGISGDDCRYGGMEITWSLS